MGNGDGQTSILMLWTTGTEGRLSRRENLQSPAPSPSSGGRTRCPHPYRGPGRQFVVFSFNTSQSIVVRRNAAVGEFKHYPK